MSILSRRRRLSRGLHWIGDVTSRAGASLLAAVVIIVFAIALALDHFPMDWATSFSAIASAVTLVMLFVVQHTQSRHQMALQLKLDELIRTSPGADDQLVHIEIADDAEIDDLKRSQQALHEAIRDGESIEIIEFYRNPDQ